MSIVKATHYYLVLFLLLVAACTEEDQAVMQTAAASIAQTAVAEGEELVLTEVAEFGGTAVSGIGTEVAEQVSTSVTGIGTEAAQALTPEPAEIVATPAPGDIVTYTVIKGDNLSKIARAAVAFV